MAIMNADPPIQKSIEKEHGETNEYLRKESSKSAANFTENPCHVYGVFLSN